MPLLKLVSMDGANRSKEDRRMIRAALMGNHAHETANGRSVNVWQRGGVYIARGRWLGSSFGETLGRDILQAAARLRKLIGEIEDGTYVRPSEQHRQPVPRRDFRLTFRQLANAFLLSKRAERGAQTAADYRARLRPSVEFSERPENLARWPLAAALDGDFAAAFKSFLMCCTTSRNGCKPAAQRLLSATQIRHCLETFRSVVNWALDPLVGKLPARMLNPLHKRLMPARPQKNPLREDKLAPDVMAALVAHMDRWQLCHLSWSFVLPLRPDEAAGLLVTDANVGKGWFEFGYRFADCNFTKEKAAFVLPYPPEFAPLLAACRRDRKAGPLLRSRRAFEGSASRAPESDEAVRELYEHGVHAAEPGTVLTEHDRKVLFRRLLKREWGGVSEDRLSAEFKSLVRKATGRVDVRFYDPRHATTQGMKGAGLPHLELRYLTGHACRDILNEYTTLRPAEAMARYFESVRSLIAAIASRARELGLA